MRTSTFERRCDSKNEPRGSVEVVVDEEVGGAVRGEVVAGRGVEGEESDRWREGGVCAGVLWSFFERVLLVPLNPCVYIW